MTTGFRAGEVASLKPDSFALDAEPPVALLPARITKNRQGATQPLPPDVAEQLRAYLAGKPAGFPLWPGNWSDNAADMLRLELDACGIPDVIEGPNGPLYADFHSLRHSYIALLDKSGATLKEAMQLARHSDPKLTMAVSGRARCTTWAPLSAACRPWHSPTAPRQAKPSASPGPIPRQRQFAQGLYKPMRPNDRP